MLALVPCGHCHRHIYSNERTCGFCGAVASRPLPGAGLLVATALLAGCASAYGAAPPEEHVSPRIEPSSAEPPTSNTAPPAPVPSDEPQPPDDDGSRGDVYGGPPPPDQRR
jgi:hypothetical protein